MDTQTQIDRLIELAIIQRSELKQLVEQLPQLREHLNAEVEKVFDETEPQLRAELEEWTTKQTADKTAALGVALEAKIADLAKSLEVSTQARYNAIIAEREENARLAAQAEAKIAEHAASLPSAVKEIVSAELARFPRAGEIDQLRKEFAEPRGLNPRGKWQAGETYNKLDLVTINGDSYTSNTDGNRTRPSRSSADWTLVAARGTGGGGGPTSLSELTTVPSDGDLLIGSGTSWVTSNLTAGAGISITVGPGAITISATDGDITLDDGTAASPSLHFTNDPDTGIYRPAANTLGISTSGVQRMYVDENGITTVGAGGTFDGSVHAANGNANNPSLSFTSDQDTGFFRHQPNEIGIALGGTQYATLTSTTFSITPVVTMASSLRVNGTTDSSSKDTGAIVTEGGLGVEKSATIGGNLTVSGTGSFGGATGPHTFGNGAGAVEVRAVGDSSGYYGYSFYTGGSYESSLKHTAASGILKLDVGRNSAWGGSFEIYADTTRAARFAKTSTTLDGNLTVSGTGNSSFAGNIRLPWSTPSLLSYYDATYSLGFVFDSTNRKLVLRAQSADAAANQKGTIAFESGATPSEIARFAPSTGNLLIGTTTDSNQKLAVKGSASAPSLTANATAIASFTPSAVGTRLVVGGDSSFPFCVWLQNRHSDLDGYSYPIAINPSGGNLLIGTTTDSGQKLQVSGTMFVSGNCSFANNVLGAGTPSGATPDYAIQAVGGNPRRLFFSDGTGYSLSFSKRSSSTNTDLFTLTDDGEGKFSRSVYAEKSGAGIAGQSTGAITQFTTVNSTTYIVTMGSAKVFIVQLASGDAALCYASYKSSTITILGSDGTIVNSNAPSSTQLGIFKSANDHAISFVTGSNALTGGYGAWGFCFVGNPIISIV